MEKNFKNALFHLQNENCIYKNEYEPPKRYNRGQNMFTDRFFAKLIEQAQKRKIAKPQLSVKLGEICEGLSRDFLAQEIFSGCRRFNSWQARNDHLLKDIMRMRNQCLKRANLPV